MQLNTQIRRYMKKFTYILSSLAIALTFNSCEAWEDESYHPGENSGSIMLLKELKTEYESGVISVSQYTYDSSDRLAKIVILNDNTVTDTYTEAIYTYPNALTTKVATKTYTNSELTYDMVTEVTVDGNSYTMVSTQNGDPLMNLSGNTMTPCGVQSLEGTFGEDMSYSESYQYIDGNCSYKHTVNGTLSTTVMKDNKRNPQYDQALLSSEGYVSHNILSEHDHAENTITEYAYTYNENNYPEKAVVTIKDESGQIVMTYTQTFIYY